MNIEFSMMTFETNSLKKIRLALRETSWPRKSQLPYCGSHIFRITLYLSPASWKMTLRVAMSVGSPRGLLFLYFFFCIVHHNIAVNDDEWTSHDYQGRIHNDKEEKRGRFCLLMRNHDPTSSQEISILKIIIDMRNSISFEINFDCFG